MILSYLTDNNDNADNIKHIIIGFHNFIGLKSRRQQPIIKPLLSISATWPARMLSDLNFFRFLLSDLDFWTVPVYTPTEVRDNETMFFSDRGKGNEKAAIIRRIGGDEVS